MSALTNGTLTGNRPGESVDGSFRWCVAGVAAICCVCCVGVVVLASLGIDGYALRTLGALSFLTAAPLVGLFIRWLRGGW